MEAEILDAGAEIIWVLEADRSVRPGTAEACRASMDGYGSALGWCVGDGETEPEPGVFDDSPFSVGRGFDLIVDAETMVVLWSSSHGTPAGNENLDGAEILAEVRRQAGR